MITFINFYTGAGVGVLDVNNDGLLDIFFGGNQVSSRLYVNKGHLRFEDITITAGVKTEKWITGVSIADINQDGFDDIYLSVSGSAESGNLGNLLFINNRDNTFSEKAGDYKLDITEQTTHASFLDYDHDGYLDVFLATNPTDFKLSSMAPLGKQQNNGESRGTDILLHNERNRKFTNISSNSGILIEGYSLGLNTSDFNNDGWPDIYVSNDYISNDILYINNCDGTFTDKLNEFFEYTSFASMGNDAGDINNDGLIDLITLDMLPESSNRQKLIVGSRNLHSFKYTIDLGYYPQFSRNMLQLNNGNNSFSEIGRLAGISKSDWTWAPLLADLDNDGYKDLFVTTGFRKDMGNMDFIYKTENSPFNKGLDQISLSDQLEAIQHFEGVPVENYAFKNNKDLSFSNVSNEWGFQEKTYSNGAAIADLDNDGDLEIIINNIDDYASIYENKSNQLSNHFLKIRLVGPANNKTGIGSKLKIYYKGNHQFIENNPFRGYMSTVEKNIIFGMGNYTIIDSLVVVWPDEKQTTLFNLDTDRTVFVHYQTSSQCKSSIRLNQYNPLLFNEISKKIGIKYRHKEDAYQDLVDQPLLPRQYSQLGPAIAVGDINNDGLEDIFIGGAKGFCAKLFFQTQKCTFRSEDFPFDIGYEDAGALLFDYDNDGDLDLYVISGGNHASLYSDSYLHRLYENIGGRFKKTTNTIPEINSSSGAITAADFDKDNDLDLFVGGRISPWKYPYPPESQLLENRNGVFADVTDQKAPGLKTVGMVTSALWSDFNDDGETDLIVVGEWMPVTLFENMGGLLRKKTKEYGLDNTSGWWNSISSGCFEADGSLAYVIGNLGLNNPYYTSDSHSLKIMSKDYDNNGKTDPLLFMKYKDGYYPLASRSQFLSAFPVKAKKYNTYQSYAMANAEHIISDLGLKEAIFLEAKVLANSVLVRQKDGKFILKPLPNESQFSPIFGTYCSDFDGDRKSDILFVGNFYPNNIDDGPYSSSTGGLISWKSDNTGIVNRGHKIGFNVHSDARALASILMGNKTRAFIVSSNNDSLKMYSPVIQNDKHIKLNTLDAYGFLEFDDGIIQKQEFYYGSGYLSQSSRYLTVSPDCKKVRIYSYSGKERVVTISK